MITNDLFKGFLENVAESVVPVFEKYMPGDCRASESVSCPGAYSTARDARDELWADPNFGPEHPATLAAACCDLVSTILSDEAPELDFRLCVVALSLAVAASEDGDGGENPTHKSINRFLEIFRRVGHNPYYF